MEPSKLQIIILSVVLAIGFHTILFTVSSTLTNSKSKYDYKGLYFFLFTPAIIPSFVLSFIAGCFFLSVLAYFLANGGSPLYVRFVFSVVIYSIVMPTINLLLYMFMGPI